MLRVLLFFGLLAAASPALADVTGRYRGAGGELMTVEVNESGVARVGVQGGPTYTIYDGRDGYVVETEGGATRVVLLSDYKAALDEFIAGMLGEVPAPPAPSPDEGGGLTAAGAATVEGRTGTEYRVTEEPMPEGQKIVLSEDPQLAPLGLAWSRAMAAFPMGAPFAGPAPSAAMRQLGVLLETQAPLQLGEIRLMSVSFEEIPEARFQIPSVPISRAEVVARLAEQARAPEPEPGE